MTSVDELIELLRDAEKILIERAEEIPKSIEIMIKYCENYIKRNKFEISHFNAHFDRCRADLVRLSNGGYIWFSSAAEREKSLEMIDILAERIRNPTAEVAHPKPGGLGRIFGFIARKSTAIQKAEKLKPKKELKGLERYKIWCQSLLREFEAKFNPNNPNSMKAGYQTAKRIFRIIEGPLFDLIYHGGFESRGSQLSGGDMQYRRRMISFLSSQTQIIINHIDKGLTRIRQHISHNVLSAIKVEIFSLKSGWEPGVGANDLPSLKFYIGQINSTMKECFELLILLPEKNIAEAIMLQEDLNKLRAAYQSLILDRDLWIAFYEDCISGDREVYDFSALNNYNNIRHNLIGRICDEYERAFSIDHLSETDKGMAFILGEDIEPEDIRVSFNDTITTEVPQEFRDPSGFLRELGVAPIDLHGKQEREIKKLLKYKYYNVAKRCHPDLHPGDKEKEEQFKKLSEAYEVLSNPARRKEYLRL